jgi:hypothetical protein
LSLPKTYYSFKRLRNFFLISTKNKSEVELELKAGQTGYVKGTIQMGVIGPRANIQLTDESTGEKELASCKLIPADK